MINPIIRSKRSLSYFFFVCFLLSSFHVFLLFYFYKIEIKLAIMDSLIFNITFCFLALNSWHIVKYLDIDVLKPSNIIINHLATAIVAISLWLLAGILFFKIFKIYGKDHLAFVYQTLPARFTLGFLLYSGVILLFYSFNYYYNLQEKINRETQLQSLVKEAELNALKSQINPHFIFNSLNSISSLTILRPAEAREMIIKLSEFIRYALHQDMMQLTQMKTELENLKRYLEIEKIRFGDRLMYKIEVSPDAEGKFLPNMILQPLLENAIKHGVHQSTESVNIEIFAKLHLNYLSVRVYNNYDCEVTIKRNSGIGLENIQKRLRLIYNNGDLVKINNTGNSFEVLLLFPQQTQP